MNRILIALATTSIIAPVGAFAAEPTGEPASAIVSPGQINWNLHVESPVWVLTVAGEDIHYRERFEQGARPTFRPVAPDGERLVDGDYKWELRAVSPTANPEEADEELVRERPVRSRSRSSQNANVRFERRSQRREIVAFGSFQVVNGGFVAREPEADEELATAPSSH